MAEGGYSSFTVTGDLSGENGKNAAKVNESSASLLRVLKDIIANGQAFNTAISRSKDSWTQTFYVANKYKAQVQRAFDYVSGKSGGEDGTPMFSVSRGAPAVYKSFSRKILPDDREMAGIKASVLRQGGTISQSKNDLYYNISVPSEVEKSLSESIKAANERIRTKMKEKVSPDELEAIGGIKNADNRDRALREAYTKASRVKAGSGKVRARKGKRGVPSSMRSLKTFGALFLITSFLKMLVDLVKDIFNFLTMMPDRALKDTMTGQAIGLSAIDVFKYTAGETAKGLPAGTVTKALQNIQTKFGNPLNLDTEALKNLAPILGEDTEQLVKSGLGGKDPAALMNVIMKSFMNKIASGKTITGDRLPVDELIRYYLNMMSQYMGSDMTNILSRQLVDRYNPGNAQLRADAQLPTTSWLLSIGAGVINPAGINNSDIEQLNDIKAVLDQIRAIAEGIKTGILVNLTEMFRPLIDSLRFVLRNFMNPDAKVEDIKRTKDELASKQSSIISLSRASQASYTQKAADFADLLASSGVKLPKGMTVNDVVGVAKSGEMSDVLGTALFNNPNREKIFLSLKSLVGTSLTIDKAGAVSKDIEDQINSANPKPISDTASSITSSAFDDAMGMAIKRYFSTNTFTTSAAGLLLNGMGTPDKEKELYDSLQAEASRTIVQADIIEALGKNGAFAGMASKGGTVKVVFGDQMLTLVLKDQYGKEIASQTVRNNLPSTPSSSFEANVVDYMNWSSGNSADQARQEQGALRGR